MTSTFALILALAVAAMAASDVPLREQFDALKVKAGRTYSSPDDEARHFAAFERNSQTVVEMNRRNPLAIFKLSLHNFDALPPAPQQPRQTATAPTLVDAAIEASSHPSHLDWRTKGAVGPVYDTAWPHPCYGANLAVTVAGNVASTYFVKNHLGGNATFVAGSPEQLVDCYTNKGCIGGPITDFYRWIQRDNGGEIATLASYPYNVWRGKCKRGPFPAAATIDSFAFVAQRNETKLTQYVTKMGPIATTVYAGHVLLGYTGGIITNCHDNHETDDFSVLVVGYDLKHAPPYWIVKNTLGPRWGENGYFRILYDRNICGIGEAPITAVPANGL